MTLGFIFWLVMLLCLIFGAYMNRPVLGTPIVWGGIFPLWILLLLLGIQTFGWPIKG